MQIFNLSSPVNNSSAVQGVPSAVKLTTIVDGVDLQLSPAGLKESPLERSAIGNGIFGKVHFLWPEETSLSMLTVFYSDLSKENTRRLIAALGPRTIHDKTLSFVVDTSVSGAVIPGSVNLKITAQGLGLWSVTVETPAKPNIYATGGLPT